MEIFLITKNYFCAIITMESKFFSCFRNIFLILSTLFVSSGNRTRLIQNFMVLKNPSSFKILLASKRSILLCSTFTILKPASSISSIHSVVVIGRACTLILELNSLKISCLISSPILSGFIPSSWIP